MGYRAFLAAAFAVACLVVFPHVIEAADGHGEIAWVENISSALNAAEKSGKPVMVDIWAVWCVPCKEMDKTTYIDQSVISGAERFVPLKVDADVKVSFIERYDIDAYPTLLFLDGKGHEITRWRGAIAADTLNGLMDKILDGYGAHLELHDESRDPAAAGALAQYYVSVGNGGAAVEHLRAALKAAKNSGAETRDPLELQLAEAQVASGSLKAACKTYSRLAESAELEEVRGKALLGLAQVEHERGNAEEAGATLERLKTEFPEFAATAGF